MAARASNNGKRGQGTTRRVTTEYIEPEAERESEITEGYSVDPGEEVVQSIIDGLGPGDIKIKISKWGPKGAAYCFSTEGEIDEDFIQAQFGGGRYSGKIFVDGMFRKAFTLNIADRIANPANGSGVGVADLQFRMMQEQINMLKELLLRGNGQQATPLGELASAMKTMHELNGGGVGEKAMDLFMKGLEVGRAGGDKDSWPEIIKESLPLLEGFLMQRRAAQPQQQTTQQAAQPVTQSLPSKAGSDSQKEKLRGVITYLKQKATVGADPGFFVEWVGINCEQAEYQEVIRFILASEFSALTDIDPEIGKPPLVKFFRDLYDGLRSSFGPEDSVEMDTGGAGGNGGNASGNGGTGKGGKSGAKKAG